MNEANLYVVLKRGGLTREAALAVCGVADRLGGQRHSTTTTAAITRRATVNAATVVVP